DLIVDAYHKSSRDFLMQLPLPNIYGGGSGQGAIGSPYVNLGKMDNRGIDVSLNTVNIDRGKFKWKTGLTYSVYRNEIVELATDNSAVTANSYFYGVFDIFTRSVIDRPIGQFYGFVTDGIFETEEQILAAPVQVLQDGSVSTENPQGLNYVHNRDGVWLGDIKYKDINNDGVINTDDQTFIGNPNPKFSFGLNNSFTYGNFDLTVYITGVYGFDIFNASRIRTEGMLNQSNNQLATIANRAQIEMIDPTGSLDDINNVRLINPGTDIPRFTSTNVNGNARIMQDRWIEDGSFVRIQNVSLGYMLPSSLISKVNLNRVRVYFNAQNLHVFTNYSGLDPEVGASNQNILTAGIDTGRYPTPRVFTLGLNVDF
ncbi:MAG TPA: TonB-dependent receptor, partial [Ohtaekwangia sp.]|nr:TonB-dependent receptor [Ohtaekwangia sp.]